MCCHLISRPTGIHRHLLPLRLTPAILNQNNDDSAVEHLIVKVDHDFFNNYSPDITHFVLLLLNFLLFGQEYLMPQIQCGIDALWYT